MRSPGEDILQFIWQYKLLKPLPLLTTSGKEIQIIRPGELNKDSGPDFFNAQIRIDNIVLAGNIEVHVKSGDWLKHNHQLDKTYDNIILHVVYEDTTELRQNKDNNVEVLEIKTLVPENLLANYDSLLASKQSLPCSGQLETVNELKFNAWMQRMLVERLENKVKRFEDLFQTYESSYSYVFYTCLLRNFGFKVNALPFELLAKQLPPQILLKHSDNLLQLEALLLGTAGFLEDQFENKYLQSLQNEYEYLKKKYGIMSLEKEIFKFSKLRPANFPTIRLAQFAKLIFDQPLLLQSPASFDTFKKLKTVLNIELEGYWKNHYSLDGNKTAKDLKFGQDSVSNLIINTFAPFFFFYFKKSGISAYEPLPMSFLEKCVFERNSKSKLFTYKKGALINAGDSQALINLYDNYCAKKKCLCCGIGTAILQSR